jgi:hypothetical protein
MRSGEVLVIGVGLVVPKRERETVNVNGTGLHTSRERMLWRCGGGGGGDAGKVVRSRRKGA